MAVVSEGEYPDTKRRCALRGSESTSLPHSCGVKLILFSGIVQALLHHPHPSPLLPSPSPNLSLPFLFPFFALLPSSSLRYLGFLRCTNAFPTSPQASPHCSTVHRSPEGFSGVLPASSQSMCTAKNPGRSARPAKYSASCLSTCGKMISRSVSGTGRPVSSCL